MRRPIALARQAPSCGGENNRGKGNVVRRMFADLEADIYIMADGDGTYDADSIHVLMAPVLAGEADMAVGARAAEAGAHRPGHAFGNRLFNQAVGWLFGKGFTDIFSGYRVFNHRFVKSFPALSTGFEIETELTIHALELRMPVIEFPLPFRQRPAGSASKLKTVRDGLRISRTILLLFAGTKPFSFFGLYCRTACDVRRGNCLPRCSRPIWKTGLVPRFPTAILSTGMMITALLSLTCGVILDSVARGRREAKTIGLSGDQAVPPLLSVPAVTRRPIPVLPLPAVPALSDCGPGVWPGTSLRRRDESIRRAARHSGRPQRRARRSRCRSPRRSRG